MAGFYGMDTDQVGDLGTLLEERATALQDLLEALGSRVDQVTGSAWSGPDAQAFAESFHGGVGPQLAAAAGALRGRGQELGIQVQQQDDASGPDGFGGQGGGPVPFGPGGGPLTGTSLFLGADWGDISFSEFWGNLLENIGIDGVDSAGGIVSTSHSFAKNFGEWMMGKGTVPAFVPMIGDAFTGIMAGVDRWNDDQARADLSTGERVGRAILDGTVNFLGSMGGSFIGGSIGSSIGASIGGLFGGGGGAAAGAPAAGVGAVPGAVVGGGTGVAVGTVLGGIVGDVAGSYLGATVADSLIDTFLD